MNDGSQVGGPSTRHHVASTSVTHWKRIWWVGGVLAALYIWFWIISPWWNAPGPPPKSADAWRTEDYQSSGYQEFYVMAPTQQYSDPFRIPNHHCFRYWLPRAGNYDAAEAFVEEDGGLLVPHRDGVWASNLYFRSKTSVNESVKIAVAPGSSGFCKRERKTEVPPEVRSTQDEDRTWAELQEENGLPVPEYPGNDRRSAVIKLDLSDVELPKLLDLPDLSEIFGTNQSQTKRKPGEESPLQKWARKRAMER